MLAYSPEEEQGKGHGAVLDEEARHQLALALRQVERGAVRLGQRADEEDDEHREERDEEPDGLLRLTMSVRLSEPTHISTGHDDEAHRDLVAHHLRRAAERAEEGVLRVARPPRDDDAVDASEEMAKR
jgi:hypothetical protein